MDEPGVQQCAACGDGSTRRVGIVRGWVLLRCAACGHHMAVGGNLRETGAEQLYSAQYAGFGEDAFFRLTLKRLLAEGFAPRLRPGARILDVGCGNGTFLDEASSVGYRVTGQDVSEAAVQLCRQRGHRAEARGVAEVAPGESFDAATLWDVIEHIDNPVTFLQSVRGRLNSGGWLFVKTPLVTRRTVWASVQMPRLAGALLQVPAHLQFFSSSSLSACVELAGFKIAALERVGRFRAPPANPTMPAMVKRQILAVLQRAVGGGNLVLWANG